MQALALCCHGTEFLRAPGTSLPREMTTMHGTFRRVYRAVWERPGASGSDPVAEGTSPWLRKLAHERVRELRLFTAGYPWPRNPQTGSWGIVSHGERGLELWHPLWRARGAKSDDPRPWRVVYKSERFSRFALPQTAPRPIALRRLEDASAEMIAFLHSRNPLLFDSFAVDRPVGDHASQADRAEIFPASWDQESRACAGIALETLNVLSGPEWNERWCANGEDLQDFRAGSSLLWTTALAAIESAAAIGTASRAAA